MERFWDVCFCPLDLAPLCLYIDFDQAESPAQVRKILRSTSFLKENEQYNRAEHYDLDLTGLCFRML